MTSMTHGWIFEQDMSWWTNTRLNINQKNIQNRWVSRNVVHSMKNIWNQSSPSSSSLVAGSPSTRTTSVGQKLEVPTMWLSRRGRPAAGLSKYEPRRTASNTASSTQRKILFSDITLRMCRSFTCRIKDPTLIKKKISPQQVMKKRHHHINPTAQRDTKSDSPMNKTGSISRLITVITDE